MFGSTFNRFNTLSVVGDSGKLHNEDRSRELEPSIRRSSAPVFWGTQVPPFNSFSA